MKSNVLTSLTAAVLACLMALPVGIAVNGMAPGDDSGILNSPGYGFSESAVAPLAGSLYQVWVEGPLHGSSLMLSMSSDSGMRWTEPTALTGTDCNPMNVQIVAGTQKLYIVWQDGLTKLLRTGYMNLGINGEASKISIYNGEKPSIAASGSNIAFTYVFSGTMNVQVSNDDGMTFGLLQPYTGLACQYNQIAYSGDKLEIVASAGIRDSETGQISSRGLYFECLSCGWPAPQFLTAAGSVTDLTYDGSSMTWSEISGHVKFNYGIAKKAGGEFGEKYLISSEELPRDSDTAPIAKSRLPPKKWTFIGYVDADNSLNSYGLADVNEMEMIGSDADLNIIVLFDGSSSGDSKAYYIQYDTNTGTITSPQIPLTDINPSWGTELNMGATQTAIDFVNYVYANYPAEHYMWDMWNHGGSWLYGMCSDDTNGDDYTCLEVRTIYETLRTDNNKLKLFDVAGYDECLMSDVSVDYDEIPFIDYICNSEDSIGGDGWEYNLVLGPLAANPDMGGEQAAWLIFKAYVDNYGTSGSYTTMSIINSTMFFLELIPAINNLAQKGIHDITANRATLQTAANGAASWQGYSWNRDLIDFCTRAVTALPANEIRTAAQNVITAGTSNPPGTQYGAPAWQHDRAILIHNQNTGENGPTIYVASPPYDTLYDTMTFTENKWDEFYKVLWGTDTSDPNNEPAVVITNPTNGGTVTVDAIVTVTGTASDTDGSVTGVEVAIDTEHFEPATGTTSWSFAWDTTGFALGPHWIQARSYDGQDYSAPYQIQVNMVDVTSNGTVDIQLPKYPAEASVKVTVKDTDLNTGGGVQTTTISVTSLAEPAGESLLLTETGGDTGVFEGFLTISRTNGAGILWVNAADTITATYIDANYGGTGPMTLTDTAIVDGTPPGPPAGLTVEWYGLFQQSFYYETFEGDGTPTFGELGWTTGGASNDWQIGTPAGLGTPPDPIGAYGGTHSIGNDLTGLGTYPGEYENGLATDSNYIYSPAINCAGYSGVELQFARFLGVETSTYDHSNIEASTSTSGPWTTIWTNTATISDSAWSIVTYDISAVADNHAAVYVRFELGATDGSVTYCGWNIDNLELLGLTSGTMHNTLNWTLSSDDGAGANDVVSYNIYRSTAQAGPWDATALIDTVGSGIATYLDPDRGEFDGINWWYVVRAIDNMGNIDTNTNAIPEVPTTNIAPSAPSNPTPANGAIGVAINPTTLSVRAADPNGDLLTVSFYNAAGPVLIGTNYNVPSGTYTVMDWNGLVPTTTYSWYATAYDGEFTTQSSTWSFTTIDMTPPGPVTGLTVEWWGVSFVTLIDEHFATDPADWTITNTAGTAWTWSAANQRMENTYGYPNSGYLDSPVVDCGGVTGTTLSFWHYWQANYASGTQDGYVRGSIDGGTTWPYLVDEFHHNNPATEDAVKNYTIPWADGHSQVRIRYDIYNNDDWYWRIDDVLMTAGGGSTTEHNWLNWTLSADDGGGANDVDHYNIYRALAASGPWDATALIDTVPAGTATYMDYGRGEPDGINWWYVIRAEDIWGNEEMNTNAVPEIGTGLTAYNIDLTGRPANSWVFVSFPHTVSGNIQTILNDATLGDAATTWTRAMWYNPQTPNDPWKTYRVGGSTNDLATIDNTMGVWLWITANGGDQHLTVGVNGDYSATDVTVNLHTGWNMVGYPSATARLGSATLPAQADRVSVWQAASPYITDSTPGAVTMSQGHAYWVHVTADCVWTVNV